MLYETIEISNKEYKLCLPMRHTIQLEKKLKTNPLNKLMEMSSGENKLPDFEFIAYVLHYALQRYQANIDLDTTYDLIDLYLEENDMAQLIEVVVKVFEVSGFFKIPETATEEAETKEMKKK